MQLPLMPKAVAIWLIENTSLTFQQIADFCGLFVLEVESLANEETHKSLQGLNPILTGELSQDEIERAQSDPNIKLVYIASKEYLKYTKNVKKDSHTDSKSKRKNKPEAMLWILHHYPEITDYQISKLLNSAVNIVKSVRAKSYWNYKNLSEKNPVTLGLCSEEDISNLIRMHSKDKEPKSS